MLNAPICWMGGKRRLRSTIINRLPEHTCYTEVFGGAGWVLFGKEPSKAEVYNDIDGDLANLFNIIKTAHRAFIEAFDLILVSRKLFRDFINTDPDDLNEVQRAVRFYYLIKTSFGGKGYHFGYSKRDAARLSLLNIDETIKEIHARLKGVYIENESYDKVITRYDGPQTVFYLDPPYYQTATYRFTLTYEDYERLATILAAIEGRFLLSINDHESMREVFSDYNIEEVKVGYSVGRVSESRRQYGELLISNY